LVAHEALALQSISNVDPLVAFKAVADPDTMYYHQAMREPDAAEFRKAMQKEIDDHTEKGHWVLVKRSDLPNGTRVLPSVWSMKRD
jgi:hypothetical protein